MNTLVLQATPTAQWYTLVGEAEQACAVQLKPELESYLVFLLMRFSDQPSLASKVFAFEFLEALQTKRGVQREQLLQTVGDSCLLYSGFFPNQADAKQVKVSYFVDVGRSAYSTLAQHEHSQLSDIFACLSQFFVVAMDLLQAMRDLSEEKMGLSPIQAQELWSDTGSQRARVILERYTCSKENVSIIKSAFGDAKKH